MSTGLARLAGLAGCTFRAELAEVAVAATARSGYSATVGPGGSARPARRVPPGSTP